jgi:hypothetical protein
MRVTVAPLMVGLVRTSTTSCVTGWNAREGVWLRVCGPFVVWRCYETSGTQTGLFGVGFPRTSSRAIWSCTACSHDW